MCNIYIKILQFFEDPVDPIVPQYAPRYGRRPGAGSVRYVKCSQANRSQICLRNKSFKETNALNLLKYDNWKSLQ
jgi:hypothetical protein